MISHLEIAHAEKERDNAYFTSTIVGIPFEASLGRAYTQRKLSQNPNLTIDAITAAIWHSDSTRNMLKQYIKQTPKILGLPYPFPNVNFARKRPEKTHLIAFLLGFGLSAALCYAYISIPWLQQLLVF